VAFFPVYLSCHRFFSGYGKKIAVVLLLFLAVVFFAGSCYGQVFTEDSLQQVLRLAKTDSEKISALQACADYFIKQKINDTRALALLKQSLELAEKNHSAFAKANASILSGNFYFIKNDWPNSIAADENAIQLASGISNENTKKKTLYLASLNLAEIYNYNGDYTTALEHRLEALRIIESVENAGAEQGETYVSVANDFRHLKQNSKAIEYIKKASAVFDKMEDHTKLDYFYEYYQNLLFFDKVDEAKDMLKQFDKGLTEYPLSGQEKLDFSSISNKLHGQFEMSYTHDYAAAVVYFKKYLSFSKEGRDKMHIGISLNKMGWAYDSLQQYPQAIAALKASFDTCMKEKITDYAYESADEMANIYEKLNDYKNAYYYSNIAFQLKDSLTKEEKLKELNFLEAQYQGSRKEKEIANLKVNNTQKELAVVKRNRLLLTGGLCTAALLLVLALLYRNSQHKQTIAVKEQKLQKEQIKFLERQQQVISLQSMVNGQETERTRIARDLHDGLSGVFSTVKMYFSTLLHEQEALKSNTLFSKSYELIDTASEEVRRIAHNMMPEVLMKLGLVPALQDMCNNISAGKLLQVNLQSYGMDKRMNASTEIMLYRIVQELLNNIIKHAQATEAIVQFNRDAGKLTITVEDNGRGFNTEEADETKHAGLATIKSRVSYLNGRISIESQQEVGTTVIMEFLVDEGS
jgi:two-component system, NarL family, sensor kinase